MSEATTVLSDPVESDPELVAKLAALAELTRQLPDSDGEPMENEREVFHIALLRDTLMQYWHDRQDFYTGGNMFLYYSVQQAQQILSEEAIPIRPKQTFRGPDFFVVREVDGSFRRQKWVVWDEQGRYPDVIVEFLSPSTRRIDQTIKKTLYEQTFKTREYYWYNPFDAREFQGWQLSSSGVYQPMLPDARGWLWSPTLNLWLGRWEGAYHRDYTTWIRFYDPDGHLLPTPQEQAEAASARAEAAEAELARLRTEFTRIQRESAP